MLDSILQKKIIFLWFVLNLFPAVDKDGDGQISREEMAAYIKSYQEESPEEVSINIYFAYETFHLWVTIIYLRHYLFWPSKVSRKT